MTNEEANQLRDEARKKAESASAQSARTQAERDAVRAASNQKAVEERRTSSKERAEQESARNAEKKAEKQQAVSILSSASSAAIREISKDGSLGRKLDREIRRFEQTGRVSNWLAGETIKAEAAQNAAQQSQFRQAVMNVVDMSLPSVRLENSSFDLLPTLSRKPELIPTTGAAADSCTGLNLFSKPYGTGNPPEYHIWVGPGLMGGKEIDDFDRLEGKAVVTSGSGSGIVWIEVVINQETGEIKSIKADSGSGVPGHSDDSVYYVLGAYEYPTNGGAPEITNYACGSIDVVVCRNWFKATKPYYFANFSRSIVPIF